MSSRAWPGSTRSRFTCVVWQSIDKMISAARVSESPKSIGVMPQTVFRIGETQIGPGQSAYIIAELACAHEGDFKFAMGQVEAAVRAQASAVKFQVFTADGLVVPTHDLHEPYTRFQFTSDQWCQLAQRARDGGLDVWIDVFEPWSLEVAERVDADGLKVHSTNVTNPYFLDSVGGCGRPVLLGTGGTELAEVRAAVELLGRYDVPLALIHGFQGYPTTVEDANIRRISTLASDLGLIAGYAGHADGGGDGPLWENIAALGLGCSLFENHLTLDRSSTRTDYHSSLLPDAFERMVSALRQMESAFGREDFELGEAEREYRSTFKAFVVADRDLPLGHHLSVEDFAFKRADHGIVPAAAEQLVGRALGQTVAKDEPLTEQLLLDEDHVQ